MFALLLPTPIASNEIPRPRRTWRRQTTTLLPLNKRSTALLSLPDHDAVSRSTSHSRPLLSASSSSEQSGRGESRETSSTTNASDLDGSGHAGCSDNVYNATVNAGTDVLFSTVGAAMFHAAIPPTVRIMKEGYHPPLEVRVGFGSVDAVAILSEVFDFHALTCAFAPYSKAFEEV